MRKKASNLFKVATLALLLSSLLLSACDPTEYESPVDVPFTEFNND